MSAEPPRIPLKDVAWAVEQQFGLRGDFATLVSERDQNYHLSTAGGAGYVVKVTALAEDASVSEFQIAALLHLQDCHFPSPRVIPALDGRFSGHIEHDGVRYGLRLVGYLRGSPLASIAIDAEIAGDFGVKLAKLDLGLSEFSHPAQKRVLLWDLQRAAELRHVLDCIDDPTVLESVTRAIDDYDAVIRPELATLRKQVIHGDANPENVLVDSSRRRISGFIDFGDMIRAPLIFEVAIAASYLRAADTQPLELIAPFVVGYHAANPLTRLEQELMFDLVRVRLATTITLLFWRLGERSSDDPYRQKTLANEADAQSFLAALDKLGKTAFLRQLRLELRR